MQHFVRWYYYLFAVEPLGSRAGEKVAVVGLGTGHMGVKIANAMGAEVTVLSQTLIKRRRPAPWSRSHYATSDASTFETLAGTFDLIINTVSAKIDVDAFFLINRGRCFGKRRCAF